MCSDCLSVGKVTIALIFRCTSLVSHKKLLYGKMGFVMQAKILAHSIRCPKHMLKNGDLARCTTFFENGPN